jgi:hypothetical protein
MQIFTLLGKALKEIYIKLTYKVMCLFSNVEVSDKNITKIYELLVSLLDFEKRNCIVTLMVNAPKQ